MLIGGWGVGGGNIPKAFADLATGLVESAARIVGGMFTGLGGVEAAITPEGG